MAFTQVGSVLVAGDAGTSAQYGSSVALNGARTVMAVGARNSNAQKGKVYIYDLVSGVWTQRGSPITAADGAAFDNFGDSVSLSADGTVLAVGAPGWEGAAADQGGVYIYDWTTVWTQRGSVITAGDAAASDAFGDSVALASNGSILAVGATARAGLGGVYIYDWTTVWTQRGSVIAAGDAPAGAYFGSGVSLSDTGSVLVVGAERRAGTAGSLQGGAYTYDWTTVWTQRGSVLTAVDAFNFDTFGACVSVAGNGTALAVSAGRWKNNDFMGRVYVYDVAGSAWTHRAHFSATDSVSSDQFGSGIDLADGGVSVVAGALGWEGTLTDQGGVYFFDDVTPGVGIASAPSKLTVNGSGVSTAATALTVAWPSGIASAASRLTMTGSGVASAPTALTSIWPSGVASGATALTVVWPSGIASAPSALTAIRPTGSASAASKLTMTGSGIASTLTDLAVLDRVGVWPQWSARCLLGGVDVSASLTESATVEAEEGGARIAQITIKPPAGVIEPLTYVGKTVTLDFISVMGGAQVARRLFTGRVDTPVFDVVTGVLSFDCVDDLQNRVSALSRAVISSLCGGRYTPAVQGDILDNWDYAQALMSTVQGALDAGPLGDVRLTPWQISTVRATYGVSSLIYQTGGLTFPQRSTLVNSVVIAFDYRYPRLRHRASYVGWSGTLIDMQRCGYAYPSQSDVESAVGGAGWTLTSGIYFPAPAAIAHSSGGFIRPRDDAIDMAIMLVEQRHSQTVTENYALTVAAPESVAANGLLQHDIRGALQSEFDGSAWESALDVAPLMPGGGDMDYAPDAPRGSADYAISTLIDQARVKILGSHRSARYSNAVLCDPEIDLTQKLAIATPQITASGKVARLVHTLDFQAGSAVTEFEIAIFGVGGAGILPPSSLAVPSPPSSAAAKQNWSGEMPALVTATYGGTPYQPGLMGLLLNPPESISVEDVPIPDPQVPGNTLYVTKTFPNPFYVAGSYPVTGFRVKLPGVDDIDRNPIASTVQGAYDLVIPTDVLTITV